MQKSIKEFIEMLEDSFREQAAALKQAAEEIQRFIVCVEAQDISSLSTIQGTDEAEAVQQKDILASYQVKPTEKKKTLLTG